jgi:hypothetical protein
MDYSMAFCKIVDRYTFGVVEFPLSGTLYDTSSNIKTRVARTNDNIMDRIVKKLDMTKSFPSLLEGKNLNFLPNNVDMSVASGESIRNTRLATRHVKRPPGCV